MDENKKWHFIPKVNIGDTVIYNSILGNVMETESITHKIMYSVIEEGKILEIVQEGEYSIKDIIAKVQTADGKVENLQWYKDGR